MKIDVTPYTPDRGLSLKWEDGFEIATDSNGSEITIRANREGLVSLARHLLTLAQDSVPVGHHIHLDDSNSLEDGSCELVLEKL